jgi:hypothetical protein
MALKLLSKSTFSVMSPEASGQINQVVPGLLFGVVQPYQQPGSCFPANSAVSVQVPHGVTGFFEFPEDLRDHLGPGAMGALIFDVVVFDIDPESNNLRHPKLHGGLGFDRFWQCCREISAVKREKPAISHRNPVRTGKYGKTSNSFEKATFGCLERSWTLQECTRQRFFGIAPANVELGGAALLALSR